MVALIPMNAEEFAAYVERSIPEFAREKVDSGQWSKEASVELARRGLNELLPRGLATPENFLFTLREAESQENVGMLWFAVQERAGQRIAYVYNILIESQYRRMGYGTRAFESLESEVASRGLGGIALHVFGHNKAARALYAKLGYQPTNINLFKRVPSAGT